MTFFRYKSVCLQIYINTNKHNAAVGKESMCKTLQGVI